MVRKPVSPLLISISPLRMALIAIGAVVDVILHAAVLAVCLRGGVARRALEDRVVA
jgi:hypothetical protein